MREMKELMGEWEEELRRLMRDRDERRDENNKGGNKKSDRRAEDVEEGGRTNQGKVED